MPFAPTRLRRAAPLLLVLAGLPARADGERCPPGMRFFGGGAYVLGDGSGSVAAADYCLDEIEVTAAGYAACVRAGACASTELACSRAATFGAPERSTHPINCVSWLEADAFCHFAGKRLPTEGEWEWAARGGARGTPFPWGAAPPARQACWDGRGNAAGKGARKETCPVASHPDGDSPDGLHDLAGNVREWTASSLGRFRIVRGGSWGDSLPEFLSAAFRGMNAPDERFELTGFRCAADAGPEPARVARTGAPPAVPPAAPRPTTVIQLDALRIDLRSAR